MLELRISEEEISQATEKACERLNNTIYSFRSFFNNLYSNRMRQDGLESIIRFERFLGMQGCIKERCRRALRIDLNRELTIEEDHHLNLYSLMRSAERSLKERHDADPETCELSFDYQAGEYSLIDSIIRGYMNGARRRPDSMPQYTDDFLTRILDETSMLTKKTGREKIRISFNGDKKKASNIRHKDYSEIIGAEEAVHTLRYTISRLCCYDPEQQKNIYSGSLPKSILLYGPPGSGKTSLIDASIGYAQMLCDMKGMPFNPGVIDNSLKSMWMGKSVENIRRMIEDARSPDGAGLIIIDDFDMVLNSRQSKEQNFGEVQVLHELLNQISGYGHNNDGNHIYLLTSNMPGAADTALFDRIEEKIPVRGCCTQEDFKELLNKELGTYRDHADDGVIEKLSSDLGRMGASGRTATRMARSMIRYIDHRIPGPEFICAPYHIQAGQNNGYRRFSMKELGILDQPEVRSYV
ncbi:AAA family ATPase [Candidatus Woesearchaeota archaeon]|nr:AAA family ATPase [Candidatus Woesearchaeota archaeon]